MWRGNVLTFHAAQVHSRATAAANQTAAAAKKEPASQKNVVPKETAVERRDVVAMYQLHVQEVTAARNQLKTAVAKKAVDARRVEPVRPLTAAKRQTRLRAAKPMDVGARSQALVREKTAVLTKESAVERKVVGVNKRELAKTLRAAENRTAVARKIADVSPTKPAQTLNAAPRAFIMRKLIN